MIKTGLINTLLRGLTLGSKFLLLLFLARLFTPEELGIYGLMAVTISIALYLLGLDFYTYNTREILAGRAEDYPRRIRDQMIFHLMTYAGVLPLLVMIFVSGFLPWRLAWWFYVLLLLEHLSQEAYRVMITLSRSNRANLVLFLRSGVWVFAIVAAGLLDPQALTLNAVFVAWGSGVLLSLAVAAYTLRNLAWRSCLSDPVDWPWIRRGVGVSLRFFIATLALLGIEFADRYFLQHFHGEAAVGVYTFFGQIANSIQVFVATAVVMVIYPRVVESWQKGKIETYVSEMKTFARAVIAVTMSLVFMAALGIDPALRLVGKDVFSHQINVYWIMLGSSALLALSYIPHYALYASNRDRAIVGANIIGLGVAISGHVLLVPAYGATGAVVGTLAGICGMTAVKLVVFLRNSTPVTQRRVITLRRWKESTDVRERAEVVRNDD